MKNNYDNARIFAESRFPKTEHELAYALVEYADMVNKKDLLFKEQEIVTKTEVHFDFVDKIKILFGSIPEVTVKVILPTMVDYYNAVSNVKMLRKTKIKFSKDKPDFGYEQKCD